MNTLVAVLLCAFVAPAAKATVSPTMAPTPMQPTGLPTQYPTQVLQTRFNIYVNLKTTPQFNINYFKANYRSAIEDALVDILETPRDEVVEGQVLVTGVEQSETGSVGAMKQSYSVTGDVCSLPSDQQNLLTVKLSYIFENTGYETRAAAFIDQSQQVANATDNGLLKSLLNANIRAMNRGLELLNVSCFASTSDDITEFQLRTPIPSAAPTSLPKSDGPKKYAVAICMSAMLCAALFVMAAGSVVDNRDRFCEELIKANSTSLAAADDMSPVSRALQEAVDVVKSAVPYIEFAQPLDILRAHVSFLAATDESAVEVADMEGVRDMSLTWTQQVKNLLGAHDGRYAQNIWLQHRWFSCIFYAPNKSRAMRCFCVFYFSVLMLCFDCLLIVHTDILQPARQVETLFVRGVIILVCITALVSSCCYGIVETIIYFCFDDAKEYLTPLIVEMGRNSGGSDLRLPVSNWQSVSVDSIGDDQQSSTLDIRSPTTTSRSRRSIAVAEEKNAEGLSQKATQGRSVSAQLGRGGRPADQKRSPSPQRSPQTASRRLKLKAKKNKINPRVTDGDPAALAEKLQSAFEADEYLYSESIVDELLRLQDDIIFCREAIHAACSRYNMPALEQYNPGTDGDNYEIAIEDALLAVQFDAVWGLDSQGSVLAEGDVLGDWRDRSHCGDGNFFTNWWKDYISKLFTAYKGEELKPREGKGLNNPLLRLASDIVRVRRQVLKEQLKLYSDIVAVQTTFKTGKNNLSNASADFDFLNSDPYQLLSLNTIKYLSPGDDVNRMRKRVVQLFHEDTLPPVSASIVRNQIHRNRWMTSKLYANHLLRVLGMILTILSLVTMIGVIYYYSFHILNKRQTSIVIVFLFWMASDVFLVETLSLLVRHVVIPSFAHHDVAEIISWLIFNVIQKHKIMKTKNSFGAVDEDGNPLLNKSVTGSDSNLRVRPSIHGEIIPDFSQKGSENMQSMRLFNAAKHMFVSVRLANATVMKNQFLEALSISEFQTLWPQKAYLSAFGARNNFGYFNENGVCLFADREDVSQASRSIVGSRRDRSVAPQSVGMASSVTLSAHSVAQWVPQSAREDKFLPMTIRERISFDVISKTVNTALSQLFLLYIEVLPILLQNILLDLVLWAIVLWFFYLFIYIINVNAIVIILPALAVVTMLRYLLSKLLFKNRLGLTEDEFEVEPEIQPTEMDEDYFDGQLQREDSRDRSDDLNDGGSYTDQRRGSDEEFALTERARHDVGPEYDGDSNLVDPARDLEDQHSNQIDAVEDRESDFGNDDEQHYQYEGQVLRYPQEPVRGPTVTTGAISERPAKARLGKTVSLPPMKQEERGYERQPPGRFADESLDDGKVMGRAPLEYSSEEERSFVQQRRHQRSHQDTRYSNSAHTSRERALVAVAGGASYLRSTTAYGGHVDRVPQDDFDDDSAAHEVSKGGKQSAAYEENDTPFTEVPGYDSAYKGGARDPFQASSAITPAAGAPRGKKGFDTDNKYNPIISPPNATPQLDRKSTNKKKPPGPRELLTDSVVKRSEAEMRAWAQGSVTEADYENPKELFQMFEEDLRNEADGEEDIFEEGGSESDEEVQQELVARGTQPLTVAERAEQDRIVFTMSRYGKSN